MKYGGFMYKILVVDDEQWIRKWLVKMIPTLLDNVEVINSYDNGEKVIQEIEKYSIDIVVSDIRMPIVGGLELIKEANKKNLNTKFILISGYDEFEYARSALKLGVVDYLLKPIEKIELNKALNKAIGLIENEKSSCSSHELVQGAIYKILYSFINDGDFSEFKKINPLLNRNNIKYDFIRIGLIQSNTINKDEFYIKDILFNNMKDKLVKDLKILILEDSLNYVYIIFHQGITDNIEVVFNNLKRELENKDGKNVAKIIYSPWFKEIESFPYYFNDIKDNLVNINLLSNNTSKAKLEEIKARLTKYISIHDKYSLKEYLSSIQNEQLETYVNVEDFRLMLFNFISDIISKLNELNDDTKKTYITEGYDFCIKIYNYSNFRAMFEWLDSYTQRVIEFLIQHEIFDVTQIVKQVYKQIQIDYSNDVTLSLIAEKYKINSSYFSKKFKELIGENFVDFLTNIRIEASKELLVKTDKPIKDISLEVGFKDSKYFSKVFAQHLGISPSVYRTMR